MTMDQQLDAEAKRYVIVDLFCGAGQTKTDLNRRLRTTQQRRAWLRRAKIIGFILLAIAAAVNLVLSSRVTLR